MLKCGPCEATSVADDFQLRQAVNQATPGPASGVHDDICPLEAILVCKVVLEHLPCT